MSNYHLKPLTALPSLAAQEAKLKRKKLLEDVQKRRKEIYKRFYKKLRQSTASYEPEGKAFYRS